MAESDHWTIQEYAERLSTFLGRSELTAVHPDASLIDEVGFDSLDFAQLLLLLELLLPPGLEVGIEIGEPTTLRQIHNLYIDVMREGGDHQMADELLAD